MDHDDSLISRRPTAAAAATNGASFDGSSSSSVINGNNQLDAAESGLVHRHHQQQQHSASRTISSSTTNHTVYNNGDYAKERRRRLRRKSKESSNTFLSSTLPYRVVVTIHRRMTRFLKRHPEKLPWLVGGVLVGAIGVCLISSAIIHYLFITTGGGNETMITGSQRHHHHHVGPDQLIQNTNLQNTERSRSSSSSSSSTKETEYNRPSPRQKPAGGSVQQSKTSSKVVTTQSPPRRKIRPYDIPRSSPFSLLFDTVGGSSSLSGISSSSSSSLQHSPVTVPPSLDDEDIQEGMYIDYGDLKLMFFDESEARRQIILNFEEYSATYRDVDNTPADDDQDAYFAFDDDVVRNEFADRKQNDHGTLQCRRISEHRINYQTCNNVHELDVIDMNVKFLGEGSYRAVVGLEHTVGTEIERVAMKDITYERDRHIDVYEYSRMDAMVAERLTASPRIFDIYGFCGLSIVSEFFQHGDIEPMVVPHGNPTAEQERELKDGPLQSLNDIEPSEKLRMSLQMAEGIADLHGNAGGVIVHQDVQLSQFLFNSDKSILKLNDFNRAEFMLWNENDDEYCKYTEFVGNGSWRSPEEYFDNPLNEQVDVYSLGNNMYSVLTGLWVFPFEAHTSGIQKRIKNGETAYIDPRFKERSVEEAKLVEAIEWCHQYNPEDRPTIFQLVDFLRRAVEESKS